MWNPARALALAAAGFGCAILACQSAPLTSTESTSAPYANGGLAPVQVPLFEEFQDLNPCTGQVVTYTLTGTARIQESGDRFILVARGSAVTSDGFVGSFNRQFVIIGDRVTHLRFHDMEVSSEGQRIVFGVGLVHQTSVNGQPVVSFEHFSGVRCVGRGAA